MTFWRELVPWECMVSKSVLTNKMTTTTLTSIKKSAGTLSKVQKMIEEGKYCPDIIQQIDASIGLLKSAKNNLLKGHLEHCLEFRLKENKQQTIEELTKIYKLGEK